MSAPNEGTVNCPVCALDGASVAQAGANSNRIVQCRNCGSFELTASCAAVLAAMLEMRVENPAILSHQIWRMQKAGGRPVVDTSLLERSLDGEDLPSPAVQAANLLLSIREVVNHPGQYVDIDLSTWRARVGALNPSGVHFIFKSLLEAGLVEGSGHMQGFSMAAPSFSGWQELERIQLGSPIGRLAFMAMKFGDAELDRVFLEAFKPAAKRAGFVLRRLDEQPVAGLIDDRMRTEIRRSHFVVADLTHRNLGAYWEAGFAEGLGKPVIYSCRKDIFEGEGTHFDTNHSHTVPWEPDALEVAAEQLLTTIRATLPGEAVMIDDPTQ